MNVLLMLRGYVLFQRTPIFVRGYLVVLGAAGVAVGWWANSIALATISAFLLGGYFAPMLPIWQDPTNETDHRRVAYYKAGPGHQMAFYYWLVPLLAALMIGCVLLAILLGWPVPGRYS